MIKDLNISIPYEDLQLSPCAFFRRYRFGLYDAFGWQNTTKKSYENYIVKLEPYLTRPLIDAENSDYSRAIEAMNAHQRRKYSENTLKSIRSIINDICYFAQVYSDGIFFNPLWGTGWNTDTGIKKPAKTRDEAINQNIRLKLRTPKSLSIPEELKLLDIVKSNFLSNSLYLGVAIMFYMGLRPGECCGLSYGDIRPVSVNGSRFFCMYIYSQARSRSEHSYSLKTANAYRVLPVPYELCVLLDKRFKYISSRLSHTDTDIYKLPILCLNESVDGYVEGCNPRDFMLLCKKVLWQCKIDGHRLDELSGELRSHNLFQESAATSYLLRRNFATALAGICGMDDEEIKYEMGHTLIFTDDQRSDFLNPDRLLALWKKLNRRHYDKLESDGFSFTFGAASLVVHQAYAEINVDEAGFSNAGGIKEMDVWCDYPNDNIKLKILSGDADSIEAIPMSQPVALREAERVWIQRDFSAAVIASANRSEGRKKSS